MTDRRAVALGKEPADLVVRGGRVFRPETMAFDDVAVAVVDDRVAALPEDPDPMIGPETDVVEATGRAVVPGFIDAHTHLDLHQTFESAYHYAIRGGTTTVVTEAASFGSAFGADGVRHLLDATDDLPVTVRATVPPGPLVDTFTDATASVDDLAALLDDDRVVGVGEIGWIHAVGEGGDTIADVEELHARARERDLPIAGHGAGCREASLQAFASVVDNDHEAISAEGIRERVENGVHAIGRYGSVRDDVEALAEAATDGLSPAELSLSTDGMWPRKLVDEGHVDVVVERVVEEGVSLPEALRMATLTPARHYGLDDRGSLAPGNVADIVVLEDLRTDDGDFETVDVSTVVTDGEVVLDTHDLTVSPRVHEYPDEVYGTVSPLAAGTLSVPADAADEDGSVRALDHQQGLITTETRVAPPAEDGELHADPDADLAKVALVDRHPDADRGSFVGFLTGLGLDEGAVATTTTWEAAGTLVAGTNDADMQTAVAHLAELGGGWAVVADGDVVADAPAPVGGFCSALDVQDTAKAMDAVDEALSRLGADPERPMLALQTLTFTGVPGLKLTFGGYADVTERAVVGLASQ
ncbi:adenine deaminase C-terminal domain-containing protein [Halospeciosus flavus]|uniref:adenine deaminase n=1 Tax=Halospeciosus flavus TaxID=3032283 RepID=A0ABD5YYZ8_9EURY